MERKRSCVNVINGVICKIKGYDEIKTIIDKNNMRVKHVPGKSTNKIVGTGTDGKWMATILSYNKEGNSLLIVARDEGFDM